MSFFRTIAPSPNSAILATAAACTLALLPIAAQAQIGLSHAKRGGGYLSIEGGYQNRSGSSTTAPQAGGSNPYAPGTNVRQRAFVTPNGAESSASISRGNNHGTGTSSINAGGVRVLSSTNQSDGDRYIETISQSDASADPAKASAATATEITGTDGPPADQFQGQSITTSTGDTVGFSEARVTHAAGAVMDIGANAMTQAAGAAAVSAGELYGTNVFGSANGVATAVPDLAVIPNMNLNTTVQHGHSRAAWIGQALVADAVANLPSGAYGPSVLVDNASGPTTLAVASTASQIDSTTVVSGGLAATGQPGLFADAFAFIGNEISDVSASYRAQNQSAELRLSGSTETAIAKIDAQNGAFGGVSYGYVLPSRLWGWLDRLEAYGTFSNNDDNQQSSGFGFAAVSSDGRVALGEFDSAGITSTSSISDRTREIGMRFKSDNFTDTDFPLIVSFEPFYRNGRTRARGTVGNAYAFHAAADSDMYGMQLALETEIKLFVPALSFIGRVAGGGYGVHFDETSGQRIATYTEGRGGGDNTVGYRLGAEAGFRFLASEASYFSATGAVDHFSNAATLGSGAGGLPRGKLGRQTDFQAKLNFTFLD